MSAGWLVEPMRVEHLGAVLDIERRSFASPWPEEAFLSDLSGESWAHSLVLVDPGRPEAGPRGYICFWTLELELSIQNIATHPDDRRRGGASRLLEAAFEEAARAGCAWGWLEVRPSNEAAIELYARWGFVPVARRKRYYENDGEDAIVMRAPVGKGPAARLERSRKPVVG
ncbi:MAG: ribosomal protein S18-alanine N-acetyltransferase [Acidobacteria bacterium]|nr:ribosomal protein S18-alanine N-acetyltransferase [Acidobacteriota bacterium]